jgi:hypothetical protein
MSENIEKKDEIIVTGGYAALANMETLNEALAEDCDGLEFSLDKIKIPAGGGTAFEVPTDEEGETDMVKEIVGVILYNHAVNSYYTEKYSGGSNPPDCGSFDGKVGYGTPGGECKDCPYNKFGSGDGKSKACKNRRMLYILQENELFPVVLSLPPGSVGSYSNYVKRLISKGLRPSTVVTKITLKKSTSGEGINFSQAVFKKDRILTVSEKEALAPMIEQMKEMAANLTPAALVEDDNPFVDPETGEVIEPLK